MALGRTFTEALNDLSNEFMRYIGDPGSATSMSFITAFGQIMAEFNVTKTILCLELEKQMQEKMKTPSPLMTQMLRSLK